MANLLTAVLEPWPRLPVYRYQPVGQSLVVGKTIISPAGRLALTPAPPVECKIKRDLPPGMPIPQIAPDFDIGTFPAVITPQTISKVAEFNLGADVQAQIEVVQNPQLLGVTSANRSELTILDSIDLEKLQLSNLRGKGYKASELKEFAKQLKLTGGNKNQIVEQLLARIQEHRGLRL